MFILVLNIFVNFYVKFFYFLPLITKIILIICNYCIVLNFCKDNVGYTYRCIKQTKLWEFKCLQDILWYLLSKVNQHLHVFFNVSFNQACFVYLLWNLKEWIFLAHLNQIFRWSVAMVNHISCHASVVLYLVTFLFFKNQFLLTNDNKTLRKFSLVHTLSRL